MDQNKISGPPNPAGPARSDRPLGRGLEELSHVFLSQRPPEAPGIDPTAARPPGRTSAEPGLRMDAVLLRSGGDITRDGVAALLTEYEGAVEEGLHRIDANVPCDPHGEIDVLAVDRANQLVILDFDTAPIDDLLLRGIAHFDWITRHLPIVRRMCRGVAINFSLQPRLFLVSPGFSPLLESVSRHITRPRIDWIQYRLMITPTGPGIFFERMAGN
jgi:hypothetical protein